MVSPGANAGWAGGSPPRSTSSKRSTVTRPANPGTGAVARSSARSAATTSHKRGSAGVLSACPLHAARPVGPQRSTSVGRRECGCGRGKAVVPDRACAQGAADRCSAPLVRTHGLVDRGPYRFCVSTSDAACTAPGCRDTGRACSAWRGAAPPQPRGHRGTRRRRHPCLCARARAITEVCAAHGTTPPAAAIAFPYTHPRIINVTLGMRTADCGPGRSKRGTP